MYEPYVSCFRSIPIATVYYSVVSQSIKYSKYRNSDTFLYKITDTIGLMQDFSTFSEFSIISNQYFRSNLSIKRINEIKISVVVYDGERKYIEIM